MSKLFSKTNFDITILLSYLQENGFNIYSRGGKLNNTFKSGTVNVLTNQIKLNGIGSNILICGANTFIKTLSNVENQFGYKIFGDN